jgi:hypothetical protein
MADLIKAEFVRLDSRGRPQFPSLEVQFNPTEFTMNKGAQTVEIPIPGLDTPILQFVRGQAETLTLDLFFDSTDNGMAGGDVVSVTEQTDLFYQMIKIDQLSHAPPVLRFTWGAKSNFPGSHFNGRWWSQRRANGFSCIVESVRQRFTLFSPEGTALRATLSVTLKEYKTLDQQVKELALQSPDRTHSRVVQAGDTLNRISADQYDDPSQWRAIADHNGIVDPLGIQPGDILDIPPLR